MRRALGAGVAFIPSANPDGLAHDQESGSCWRKNRSPQVRAREGEGKGKGEGEGEDGGEDGGEDESVGVDINRNFMVFWEFSRLFHDGAEVAFKKRMTHDGREATYVGPSPLSEPETKSIYGVLQHVPSLTWYLDLHSAAGQVLYAWGDDEAQTSDASMNFQNRTYDHRRGLRGDTAYREYMEAHDYDAQRSVAEAMAGAINSLDDAGWYAAKETTALYPAQGSTDEAMAKYYRRACGANRINALTFEFGDAQPPEASLGNATCQSLFYPDAATYKRNVVHTSVGLMELLLRAAGADGEPKLHGCGAGERPPTPEQRRAADARRGRGGARRVPGAGTPAGALPAAHEAVQEGAGPGPPRLPAVGARLVRRGRQALRGAVQAGS